MAEQSGGQGENKPPHRPKFRAKMQSIAKARREAQKRAEAPELRRVSSSIAAIAVKNGLVAEWSLRPARLTSEDGCGCGCGCSCGCSCNVLV
jgi:hypothetical protein